MRMTMIRGLAAGFAMLLPTAAAAQVTTDAGTIEPADVERFFNQPGYSLVQRAQGLVLEVVALVKGPRKPPAGSGMRR